MSLLINKSQAYKWLDQQDKCEKIIKSIDWSSKSLKLCMARDVLLENYDNAVRTMKRIGNSGEVTILDYHDWPLFKKFRATPEFLGSYQEVFGKEFVYTQSEVSST